MSEVLRDLVVSLSLDGDNFSRNLTSINKQIQEAESEFKRAASGVDNFEKSVKGTQAPLSALQQNLANQIPRPSLPRPIWTRCRRNTRSPPPRSKSWKASSPPTPRRCKTTRTP